ncbi:MAG: O-antigen ligase family protein [Bacteroidota bacterium]
MKIHLDLNSIIKGSFYQFLWFLFFASAFSIFGRVPNRVFVDVSSVGFLFILLIHYSFEWYKALSLKKVKSITLIMLPFLIMPLVSAIQASRVFGQPIVFGLIAQRQLMMVLCAHFVASALSDGWIKIEKFEKYFIGSLHIMLFVFLFFYMFVNPARFVDTDFVTLSPNKGYRYEFPDSCIYGLFLYGLFKIWISKEKGWIMSVLLSAFYILVYLMDRTQLIAIAGTIGMYILLNFSFPRIIRTAILAGVGGVVAFGLLGLLAPDFLDKNINLYVTAVETLTGEKVAESSTNVRFMESKIALDGFVKHPIMGVGFLSTKWNDGFRSLNKHFYPVDVGILGNLFVYGILGTLVFYIPFYITFKYSRKIKRKDDALLVSSIYVMLFQFADYFTAASNQKFFGVVAVYLGIVYYYRYRKENLAEAL